MKNVVVTGGSGFLGRHLIKSLLENYPDIEITSISRSESMISALLMECPETTRLKLKLADIREADTIRNTLKGAGTVLHLAAMKRVDLCEQECKQAVTINVVGTLNLLDAFEGDTFILQSTDKAVDPCNCYGATKLIDERLVKQYAASAFDTRYMIIRSGNIIGSTGSVIDISKHQIEQRNEILVTDPDMQRFYVSAEDVVQLYMAVLEHGNNGKIYFTPKGDAVILRDIIARTLRLYGNSNTKVSYVGLRPGERMYEKMCADNEPDTVCGFEETIAHSQKEPVSTLR